MARNRDTDFKKRVRCMGYVWLFKNKAKWKSFIFRAKNRKDWALDDYAECLGQDTILDVTDLPNEDFHTIYQEIKNGKDHNENKGIAYYPYKF